MIPLRIFLSRSKSPYFNFIYLKCTSINHFKLFYLSLNWNMVTSNKFVSFISQAYHFSLLFKTNFNHKQKQLYKKSRSGLVDSPTATWAMARGFKPGYLWAIRNMCDIEIFYELFSMYDIIFFIRNSNVLLPGRLISAIVFIEFKGLDI